MMCSYIAPMPVFADENKTPEKILLDDNITNFRTNGKIVVTDTALSVNEKNNEQNIELYVKNQTTESDTLTIINRKKTIAGVIHNDSSNVINQTKTTKKSVTLRANKPGTASAEIKYTDGSVQKINIKVKKCTETTKTASSNVDTGKGDKITINSGGKIQKTKDGKYKVRIEHKSNIKYEIKDDRVEITPVNGTTNPVKIYIAFDNEIKIVNINNTIEQSRIVKEKSKVKETHKENINTEASVSEGDCVKITKSKSGNEIEYEALKPGNARIQSKWRTKNGKVITIYYNITVTELPKKEQKPQEQTTTTEVFDDTPIAITENTNVDVDYRHNTGNYANGIGLTALAHKAYREGWQYVWGGKSYGAVDCSGLIAAYCPGAWSYDMLSDTKNSYPENSMAYGLISNGIPRIHGLGLHMPGHVGVYVGNGMEIDARSSASNMCYDPVNSRGWDYWYKILGISYPDTGFVRIDGDVFYYEDGQYVVNCEKEINGKKYQFDQYGRCNVQPEDSEYDKTTWIAA